MHRIYQHTASRTVYRRYLCTEVLYSVVYDILDISTVVMYNE